MTKRQSSDGSQSFGGAYSERSLHLRLRTECWPVVRGEASIFAMQPPVQPFSWILFRSGAAISNRYNKLLEIAVTIQNKGECPVLIGINSDLCLALFRRYLDCRRLPSPSARETMLPLCKSHE